MTKLLLVEDDAHMAKTLLDWFKMAKFEVDLVADGREGLDRMLAYAYDVVILDWGLPGITGIEVCKQYRACGGTARILILTGRDTIDELEVGFTSGADDYLTKPFNLRELGLRVNALVKRTADVAAAGLTRLQGCGLEIDLPARRVQRDGKEVVLSPLEFSLLEFFMRHPNEVFSVQALLNRVWPNDSDATAETLRTTIKKLRKKIDRGGEDSIIRNLPGVGYRLDLLDQ